MKPHKRWRVGFHLLLFAVGAFVGAYLPSDYIAQGLGLTPVMLDVAQSKMYWQYGREGFAVRFMILGSISFAIGALIAKFIWNEPARWVSATLGVFYSMCIYLAVVYLPRPGGSFNGGLFLAWIFLFPIVAILLASFGSRRSNHGVQPTQDPGAADAER